MPNQTNVAMLDAEIDEFVEEYVMYSECAAGSEGTYHPNQHERALIADGIRCWVQQRSAMTG